MVLQTREEGMKKKGIASISILDMLPKQDPTLSLIVSMGDGMLPQDLL